MCMCVCVSVCVCVRVCVCVCVMKPNVNILKAPLCNVSKYFFIYAFELLEITTDPFNYVCMYVCMYIFVRSPSRRGAAQELASSCRL